MKTTINWQIKMNLKERNENPEQWHLSRLKTMLREFYLDVTQEGFYGREEQVSLQEFNEFVENWIKYHFQY